MSVTTKAIDSVAHSGSVLITGASGEIGAAIALVFARRGARLRLWGRDAERLEKAAQACRAGGATAVTLRRIDLQDITGAIAAIEEEDDASPFAVAVFAAGSGDIREPGRAVEAPGQVARLANVNFAAPAALAAALGERMAQRRAGRLILIGSAAGFHALPFAAGYAGSKAGLARFADALRIALKPHGVTVTLASPGFVDTAAARRVPGTKPGVLSPDVAAGRIVAAADRGVGHLVVPHRFALLRLVDRLLPGFLLESLLRALTPPGH